MNIGEGGLVQVNEDSCDMFHDIIHNGVKIEIVNEELKVAGIFVKDEMCEDNFDTGTEGLHLENDRIGNLKQDDKWQAPSFYAAIDQQTDSSNEDVKPKLENIECSLAQEQEDSIIKLIGTEIMMKQEEYFDSPEYLPTEKDKSDNGNIFCDNIEVETVDVKPIDNELNSLNSNKVTQEEDIKPCFSKEYKEDIGTKLYHAKQAGETNEAAFQCKSCTMYYSNSSDLMEHQKIHEGTKPFQCKSCPKSFDRAGSLTNHEKTHNGKAFKCKVCSKTFSSNPFLMKHSRIHTGFAKDLQTDDTNMMTEEVSKKIPKRDTRTMEKLHRCTICSKAFLWNSQLIVHYRIHTGEKPFQCQVCLKSFSSKSELLAHRWVHSEEKPLQCEVCSKSFIRSSMLVIHQRTHTGERPFQCEQCTKSYFSKILLVEHRKVHTGEKPYLCRYCPKSFSRSNSLKYHERTHNGEKPYQCFVCSKSFTDGSSLGVHSRIHSGERPFACTFCSKACITRGELATHERCHTGEKPFVCKVCSKPFSTRSNVTKHEKTHDKVK